MGFQDAQELLRSSKLRMKTRLWTVTGCLLLAVGCEATEVHSDGKPRAAHRGPAVVMDQSGPMRFASVLFDEFDMDSVDEDVHFVDQYYRAPANDGYEAVIDHFEMELREAGFGSTAGLELEILSEEMSSPAWTPISGSLTLDQDGTKTQLHAFSKTGDVDRVMLPINAPSASVSGSVVLDFAELTEGSILVTDAPLRQVLTRAAQRGAVGIISASLQSFNTDPSGRNRHFEAIRFTNVPAGTELPVAQISQSSLEKIRKAVEAGESVTLSLNAEVKFETRPLRTLMARIVGRGRSEEAVAMASHVQEPGACDNASGAAGLIESACIVARLLESGDMDWPARTVVFLWGDEFKQTRAWLDYTDRRPIAGFSSDMTGESHAETGAIALLERGPDPGALLPLAPDEHTPWGASDVDEDDLNPNALSVIARCAMYDVAEVTGGWISADHPWEGGSDHDEFIDLGIPAVLFWHFTDFAYHTSLDRIEMVDIHEIRKTQVALVATAIALADPQPGDLARYRESILLEQALRVEVAEAEGRADIAQAWRDWCQGAAEWLNREMTF